MSHAIKKFFTKRKTFLTRKIDNKENQKHSFTLKVFTKKILLISACVIAVIAISAITGVLVYTDSEFGPEYQNNVFIADFQQGWIKRLTCDSSLTSCGNETMFYAQAGPIVSLQQGPDGSIYALTLDGNLSRIARTDVGSPLV